jgi:hypothetical protein
VTLAVTVDPPAPLTVTCVADGDAWRAERPAAPATEVSWLGLLPGRTYDCAARAGGGEATVRVDVPAGPADLPAPVVTGATTGYTLVNLTTGGTLPRLVILDPAGRPRWWTDLAGDPNVGIEASWLEDTSRGPLLLVGGGQGWPPTLTDLAGTVAWAAPATAQNGGAWHHDTAWGTADGEEVIGLAGEPNTVGGRLVQGFRLEVFRAFGGQDPRATWSSQGAVDAGQLVPAPDDEDAFHANAVLDVPDDPDGPSFVVSTKRTHQLVRIDRATGDVTWRLGVGGDFALREADGSPAGPERWFYGQHGPEVVVRDAAAGRWDVWVHDNGFDRPGGGAPTSRVLRLDVDVPARTARLAWEWTEPGWYEPVFGDVDLLPDGHVLVTMGHCPQCGSAPRDRRTTWLELDPATGAEVWRAVAPDPLQSGYRADRIAACALFPENETYCPDGG